MRHTRTVSFALATGALARATPRFELETRLMRDSHDPSVTTINAMKASARQNAHFSRDNERAFSMR
jgi:hypothetical protein